MDPRVFPVTEQPQMQPPGYYPPPPVNQTTVVIAQTETRQTGPRMWSTGLCGCFEDCCSCFLGMCCPLALSCQVSSQMGESACVPCCVPNFVNVLRTKLRAEQNIQGSVMDDCCVATFCGLCALCQLARELNHIQRK